MQLLIKSAKVVDPNSTHHNKVVNIFIQDGFIKQISAAKIAVSNDTKIIDLTGLHVSPGFFDMQVNFQDPGNEHKEDLNSGCSSAAAGGFTGVAVVSGTTPPIHTKSEVEYIKIKSAGNIVDVYPIGTITHQQKGTDLAEMYDMHLAGSIAFSDYKKPLTDAGLLMRALLYVKNFDGLLITHCDEKSISLSGQMNEGIVSTSLGLKGMPALAEETMLVRNLFICEYADGKIHIPSVSTKRAVELIREAKKKKLKVTASVNAYSLALNESALKDFDSNCKVNPPLRTQEDINALLKGLADGTLDTITSDHLPEDVENKNVEFDYAAFGMIGLETCFAVCNTYSRLKLPELINALSIKPRQVAGVTVPKVKEKEKANLTLFLPNKEWKVSEQDIRSKSKNTPFIGKKLKGKIAGVVNNGTAKIFA